jgi:hypothetical protein
MREARPVTLWIVALMWLLFVLAVVWFIVSVFLSRRQEDSSTWHLELNWFGDHEFMGSFGLSMSPNTDVYKQLPYIPFSGQMVISLLFAAVFQGLQMIGLHAAELVVITARDEDSWRRLARREKSRVNTFKQQPFYSAFRSWENNLLLIFKSLLHWVLGQSMSFEFLYYGQNFISTRPEGHGLIYCIILYNRLMVYAICTGLLAMFITYLTFRRPSGPQPATWGHIQTLADLVDDWKTDELDQFWWGDKGIVNGVRHAGMSYHQTKLEDIRMDTVYA